MSSAPHLFKKERQIEERLGEQAAIVQKQGDEQTPKTPVPIQKGVNRLERAGDWGTGN